SLVEMGYALAKSAPGECGTALAGVVGHHEVEPWVHGTGPERRLTQARMPEQDDLFLLDSRIGLQIVHRTAQSPRPGSDRAPFIWCSILTHLTEQPVHAVCESIVEVGVDVLVVRRSHAKS